MVFDLSGCEQISVLASEAEWAWPDALRDIFRPRDVNLLVAESAQEFVDIIGLRRIHTTIVDTDCEPQGLTTIRIIRTSYPMLPCIMLTSDPDKSILSKALELGVFSVVAKPVDMRILQQQLDRLFVKIYNSYIFR